ncbi:hypothetical protein [Piscinibacter sakaiensis]|uniref:hypothetical protein n=1 Tax=Piscinibacter sakaiensis TaxID=1547922 RepID=UPI003AAE3DA4
MDVVNRTWLVVACALSGLLLSPGTPAQVTSQRPVAVVEAVQGKVEGVGLMDYVAAGQVIKLGAQDSIVLGYLKSCLRETISGGTVIVLEDQSLVQLGKVERSQVKCDSNHLQLNGRDPRDSAGNVFRGKPREQADPAASLLTLYGRSPIVEVNAQREPLIFERTDATAPAIEVPVSDVVLVRGRFVDLARGGISLAAGARYRARQGKSSREFLVDAEAGTGATPVIGRLLRFDEGTGR